MKYYMWGIYIEYVRKSEGGLRAKGLLYRYLGLKMTQMGA
jgi:hypothetical protein